jgi:DNA-binding LacI/PurR family transcriptional regulator
MVTRAEVAKLAGVSEATVSYVLSGKRKISEPVQRKVVKAMHKLDYRPNRMAQALAGGKSRVIALLFPTAAKGIANVDLEYGLGAAAAAQELGYHLVMWPTFDREITEVIATANAGLLDGVILMEVAMQDERVAALAKAGIPVGLIGRTDDESRDGIYSDRDFAGVADAAVRYFAELGHERIGFVTESRTKSQIVVAALVRAKAGMVEAAKKYGSKLTQFESTTDVDAGRRLLHKIIESPAKVTGVIALNPGASVGILQEANIIGLKVPGQLSVLSMASPDSFVSATQPRLTTISPPAYEMGDCAARRLIAHLESKAEDNLPEKLWLGELQVRETTGKPGK